MTQQFDASAKAMLTRDADGIVRDVLHVEEPLHSSAGTPCCRCHRWASPFARASTAWSPR